jgi:hypothetical protein
LIHENDTDDGRSTWYMVACVRRGERLSLFSLTRVSQ